MSNHDRAVTRKYQLDHTKMPLLTPLDAQARSLLHRWHARKPCCICILCHLLHWGRMPSTCDAARDLPKTATEGWSGSIHPWSRN